MSAPLLAVEHLSMRFGGLLAIDDLSFAAADKKITAIIGPNGAGKTTVFNCLTGFYKPTVGRLTLSNGGTHYLERMEGYLIARAGVARTFQNIRLFPAMSVLENLIVAQHNELMDASFFSLAGLFGLARYRRGGEKPGAPGNSPRAAGGAGPAGGGGGWCSSGPARRAGGGGVAGKARPKSYAVFFF